jgi:hypothetical protein
MKKLPRPATFIAVFLSFVAIERVPSPAAAAETPRLSVVNAMVLRPTDPWPRGKGHVVLALPGSTEDFKAYHEPGGSFSPAFGSFGVSFWVSDGKERLVATSDSLPLNEIEQKLVWPDKPIWPRAPDVAGVETRTKFYEATWSYQGLGRWQLRIRTKGTNHLWLMVRSVGPSGAPLASLHWLPENRLFVSDRWTLKFRNRPVEIEVVPPKSNDPRAGGVGEVKWPAEHAWGYARFKLLPNQEQWVTIDDAAIQPPTPLEFSSSKAPVKIDLPDARFADCLNAQVAHIMMGLVRNETRPGDPNNNPLNWLRDGAYQVVALARAGQVEVARELCAPFATNDFFGGFGPEADGPGLALWALTEVAAVARDEKFDAMIAPHVERKANFILEMLSTSQPLRKPYDGPIVPKHTNRTDLDLVCEPARDGLIVGKMDWHRPVLYVNAVSYRGLSAAAAFAERTKNAAEAANWRERAAALRQAWDKAFNSPESENERAYVCGLHPAWVVSDRDAYGKKLAERRARLHDEKDQVKSKPLWTYFSVAETHQWLALGQPDRVWTDLNWFWANQASPGLYTWWEGNGEENTFHRWENARGWVTPPHVTPHYWTAAEMLLLQLDMLAYLDESGDGPVLVVGAGLSKDWLKKPMRVKGLRTRLGEVDWEWNKERMTVWLRGGKCDVKLGPAFGPETPLKVKD